MSVQAPVLTVLGLLLVTSIGDSQGAWTVSPRLPHAPILIEGDSGFGEPGSGVVRGTGTVEDPYIIEGWDIVPARLLSRAGITLRDTASHVLIRDNTVRSVDTQNVRVAINGIELYNASHVTVEENELGPGLPLGIGISRSSDIRLRSNEVALASSPIVIHGSSQVSVEDSDLSCNPLWAQLGAISAHDISALRIEGNRIECAKRPGINVRAGASVAVLGNDIADTTNPILIEDVSSVTVSDNLIERSRGEAMRLVIEDNFVVERNVIRDSWGGMYLGVPEFGQGPGVLRDNVIENTTWFPFWTHGYPRPYFPVWENNTANGRPILLYKNMSDTVLDGSAIDASYVMVADSERVHITGWNLSTNVTGALNLVNVRSSAVAGNSFRNGGLRLVYGGDNTVEDNVFNGTVGTAIEIGSLRTTVQSNQIQGGNNGIGFRWLGVGRADREAPNGAGSVVTGNVAGAPGSPLIIHETADVLVHHNTFDGSPIRVFSAPGATIRQNNLLAGHLVAAQSKWPGPGFSFDARWNWWGSADGPGAHETSSGHDVTFEDAPWLEAPAVIPSP